MGYAKQAQVSERLHDEALNALELLGADGLGELAHLWQDHRKQMQLAVMNAYRHAAPHGNWNLGSFKSHARFNLQSDLHAILAQFSALTTQSIKNSLNTLYRQSCLRHAWILDQITPASRNVRVPHKKHLHEAAVTGIYYGDVIPQQWADKWSAWIDSYNSALLNNLALGASNESSVADAVEEVDATKSNTPQSTLEDAMTRIYDYAATDAMVAGETAIADMNDGLVQEEIWKTRGDLDVCDECSGYEGLTIDEVGEYPPAHPHCHCFPLLVPKEYADLLRSGDEDDRLLARDMHRDGIVPTALVIRNDDGDIAAKAMVSFDQWIKGEDFSVTTP